MKQVTPPMWMRHFISWKLLGWIDRHTGTCWASMVTWKLGYGADSWWPTPTCFWNKHGWYDYCGKFEFEQPEVQEEEA